MSEPSASPVLRFAPSPNGHLHLGHAYSALLNDRIARRVGGRLLLRLEDIDAERCREDYAASIVDDLAWLGIAFDPLVRRQADQFPRYRAGAELLVREGLLYPCFCSRGAVAAALSGRRDWPSDPDGAPLYPGTCRALPPDVRSARLAAGERAAWRLDTARALARRSAAGWCEYGEGEEGTSVPARPEAWGDPVIVRRDIGSSYHLSVVLDDADQGVTDVVRGEDLFHATSLHRLLQDLLSLPVPRYHHHRLIVDAAGRKLSKSRQAPSLRMLRREGRTPQDIRSLVGLA